MIDNPVKRKDPESDAGSSTDDLQTKRIKITPKETKTSPRSPRLLNNRPGTLSMGLPPLPAARLSRNSGNKGPLKKTQSSIRPKHKTRVPSHLQQLSRTSVRPPAHSTGSSPFITTPVIPSQSTFSPPARPRDAGSNGSVAINYVAKLQGPPWLLPATRPQGPKNHSEPGISAGAGHYQKRGEATGFSNLREYTWRESPPPRRGMIRIPSAADPTLNIYQFHASKSLGEGNWPVISFGHQGPLPRWRLWLHEPDLSLGKARQLNLIRTHQNRTNSRGLNHESQFKSNDSTIGLGALHWELEPGPAAGWGGLSGEQLYEYAYKCLEDTLNDHTSRHQIRQVLRGANLSAIAHVEDSLPPLPPPPAVTHFGPEAGVAGWPKIPAPISGEVNTYFDNRYWLPSMAVRPGKRGQFNADFLVIRMRHHLRGTLGPPGVTSHSLNPVDAAPAPPAPGPDNTADYSKGVITGAGGGQEGKDGPINKINEPQSQGEVVEKEVEVDFGLVTGKTSSSIRPTHQDRIMLSGDVDVSKAYYNKCKAICEDRLERYRYFPVPRSVHRVRTWAGSSIPASQARKWNLPSNAASERPFSPFKKFQTKTTFSRPTNPGKKRKIEAD